MEKIKFHELSKYTSAPRGIKKKIFLHWSGCGDYNSLFSGYHINITGNGKIYIDGSLADVRSHTWMRNSDSIGISVSCMGGDTLIWADGTIKKWGDYPPTDRQIIVMARVVAKLCVEIGINIADVLSHSEIAEIDGYGIFNQSLDDKDIRWDLRGFEEKIRYNAVRFMKKWGY